MDRLKNSKVSEFVLTDTLPTPGELELDKITVLSIDLRGVEHQAHGLE